MAITVEHMGMIFSLFFGAFTSPHAARAAAPRRPESTHGRRARHRESAAAAKLERALGMFERWEGGF